ncbi:DUF2155 domain-containing protein [Pararhodobacter sp. SW119]|uniref:DUF2155 domain-containing protein n=1 Tax=Pararhodobacter sp. SW119 TaxID=2780075 RepID=UPI001ADFA24E|nr:DUF2155 domain-containing protein [Pararhodobacter sp. SW119]
MIVRALALSLLLTSPSQGQEMAPGSTVILRGLDRIAGETTELRIAAGEQVDYGRLRITLRECRYPAENPSADAFAFLEIEDTRDAEALFSGWMIASSPALNALDHVRYDVWVIGCQ